MLPPFKHFFFLAPFIPPSSYISLLILPFLAYRFFSTVLSGSPAARSPARLELLLVVTSRWGASAHWRQTLMGPFVFRFFKRYKGQDTQTIILPISAFFLVLLMLKVFSCFLLLFYLLLCVTFYWIDTKNDTKNNKSSPGSVSGAMFGRVFFL